MDATQAGSRAELAVRNIGGIDETEVAFEPGVTVLAGRNATNRTSLLQAVMAALGSDDVAMKADAEEASVELTLGGETYARTLERANGTIRSSGEPYLADPTLADLFAFLLESNAARRAVVTDADLRDLIMEPVDTEEIQADIDRLLDRRRDLTRQLDELDQLKSRLPSLEQRRTELREEIEATESELEEVERRLAERDTDVEQSRADQAELESKLDDLRQKRSDLEDVRYNLETERESLTSLREERADVEAEYEDLPDTPGAELEAVEQRMDEVRSERQRLETELNELQSVIGFNKDVLDGNEDGFVAALDEEAEAGGDAVTDDLVGDGTVTCWTCGSDVQRDQIEATVEKLQAYSSEMFGEINDLDETLEELKRRRSDLDAQKQRRERLAQRKRRLAEEIEETQTRIEDLTARKAELREEIEATEQDVEDLESDAYEEILDLHREANQLEYDLGTLETDLERVEDDIESIETRLDEEADLKARREEVSEEITDLRTRIDRIEQQAVEEFNDHMDTVLELLEYGNIARIWLERTEEEVSEGRSTATKSAFDLHIIRQTENGTTYEDTVDNLSESEREVTGLIFALAGYLVHDVHETVPFMLLDSLEAIDSDRIADIVEYLDGVSDYLVVALLPEDAAALDDDYRRITDI